MIILDTNVLSALMRRVPDPKVVAWLDRQPQTSVWTTSITVLEVRFGLQLMPDGRKKLALTGGFSAVLQAIDHRIASFDGPAAERAGDLMAARQKRGRPVELRDTMIAGIVMAQHATLATRNTLHFEGVGISLINPWDV
jgi:predicted nucleic acid-binding protein